MVEANRSFRPALKRKARKRQIADPERRPHGPSSAALRSFLTTHVGQSWGSVCDALRHTFREIDGGAPSNPWMALVATKTSAKHGRIRVHTPHGGIVPLEAANCEFFVHPELGTLQRNEHYVSRERQEKERDARREEEFHARVREISALAQAHKIGGTWYWVELGRFSFLPKEARAASAHQGHESTFDAILGRAIDSSDRFDLERIYGKRGVYGVRKRALSYRELRELGLLPSAKV
jgi:hypothetical protein